MQENRGAMKQDTRRLCVPFPSHRQVTGVAVAAVVTAGVSVVVTAAWQGSPQDRGPTKQVGEEM